MKIFSIRNVRNDIPCPLKVLSRDARGDIPLKNHDFSYVFILSVFCRDFYSKSTHCDITLRRHAFLLRARSQK
jgi:hypothetical protein